MHPQDWYNLWVLRKNKETTKNYFLFGSLVDDLLFTPEVFNKKYKILNEKIEAPSENLINILNELVKISQFNFDNTSLSEKFIKLCRLKNYNNNWKDPALLKKFEELIPYYEFLLESKNYIIITNEIYEKALRLKEIVLNDERCKEIFKKECANFQFYIEADIEDSEGDLIKCHGTIDILIIDHDKKIIYVVDFKTTEEGFNFIKSIRKYGYHIQLSFYNELISNNSIFLKLFSKGYILTNPINIVIDKETERLYLYQYDNYELDIFCNGNNFIKGWKQTLSEIKNYFKVGNFSKLKEPYIKVKLL